MAMVLKEKGFIDRTSPLLYLPDTVPPILRSLTIKIVSRLLGSKMVPFQDGHEVLPPIETRGDGGVLFLTHKNKIVLTSLPKEDFGTDSRESDGNFLPTKTEYLPKETQIAREHYFWFKIEALTEGMFSVLTGGIEGKDKNPELAITREALEELGIELDSSRIVPIELQPFEVWQSTTRNTTFRGSIRELFFGNYPVAIDSIQVPDGTSPKDLPFRFGRFKFNVNYFCSYELTDEEMVKLKEDVTSNDRRIKIVDLSQVLDEKLKPSTRRALKMLLTKNHDISQ
ncbi:MAG: hypothetical protein U9O78_00555 [Patescibacteria group bacterium]|nr:hypothetical protein [Patescibacteria group bacterium]